MQQDMMKEKQASPFVSRHKAFENKISVPKFVNCCKNSLRADMEKGKEFLFLFFFSNSRFFRYENKI